MVEIDKITGKISAVVTKLTKNIRKTVDPDF